MNVLWNRSIPTVVDELPNLTSSITLIGYIKGGGQADIRKVRLETKDGYRIVAVKQLRHTEEAMLLAKQEIKT
ncbi:hypothetical protein BDV93DRAFT_522165 [Ceratobasidium sp. AG-I]|nr:hypothetical protein BDV93DRAFT_522165 [Ceratobasidium sp. AG-I]